MSQSDVVVIGAGPAGLIAAAAAARAGARTSLFEALKGPGARLLVTGGGRCNLTNTLDAAGLIKAFGKKGGFMRQALSAMGPDALRGFFRELGVETHSADGFHVFPVSESATSVLEALKKACVKTGVIPGNRTRVVSVRTAHGRVTEIETPSGAIGCRGVIVATGGMCRSDLGATGDGFEIARLAGHEIKTPRPGLVPIKVREAWVRDCAGVVIEDAAIRLEAGRKARAAKRGILLFTHDGLSGPAALDLSGDVSEEVEGSGTAALRIDFTPGTSAEDWEKRMIGWQADRGKAMVRTLLDQSLPSSLAASIAMESGAGADARASVLTKEARRAIAGMITNCGLTATGTGGFDRAMVTRGGVDLSQIDPATLESRLVPGLYFAGEVLDLDGPCGGYNLQWAFSSGHLAGVSASMACSRKQG